MESFQHIDFQRVAKHASDIAAVETGAALAERQLQYRVSRYGVLPVDDELASLLPAAGLERGQVYGCRGDAWLSLMCTLVGRATQEGSWLAGVNLAFLGMMSAAEHGVALQRTLCVEVDDDVATWTRVVGACVDGVDIVVVYRPKCGIGDVRRLEARIKAHGSVLIVMGDPGVFSPSVVLTAQTTRWDFSSHAARRHVHVSATGRRVYGNQHCSLVFPRIMSDFEPLHA